MSYIYRNTNDYPGFIFFIFLHNLYTNPSLVLKFLVLVLTSYNFIYNNPT